MVVVNPNHGQAMKMPSDTSDPRHPTLDTPEVDHGVPNLAVTRGAVSLDLRAAEFEAEISWEPPRSFKRLDLSDYACELSTRSDLEARSDPSDIFRVEAIRLAINRSEDLVAACALGLAKHFKHTKAAIQGRVLPDFSTQQAQQPDQPRANSFLPLNFSIDLSKGSLALSWHEYHVAKRHSRPGSRAILYQKRLPKTDRLVEGLSLLNASFIRNHSARGVAVIPEGLTLETALRWRDLVYSTEAHAFHLRRMWKAIQRMQMTYRGISYHRQAMDESGLFLVAESAKETIRPIVGVEDEEQPGTSD